ncbi:MOSC domain-containing protein [Brachybacterium sp. DNPG3]
MSPVGPRLDVAIDASHGGTIAAVCTVAQLFPVPERSLMSGIDKRPSSAPVRLLTHGVLGDVQGDREHHGGIFKAVYAFSREVRAAYAAERGEDLPDGFFGENLVSTGQDTDETVVGERWRIGTAIVEGTCARQPCGTFSARMGDPRWGRWFTEEGRCGAYFAVVEEGAVSAGDAIEVIARPDHGVTIGDTFRGLAPQQARLLLDWAQDTGAVLYDGTARQIDRALSPHGLEVPAALRSTGRGTPVGAAR